MCAVYCASLVRSRLAHSTRPALRLPNNHQVQLGGSKHWNIYAHSFLHYGRTSARRRMWSTLAEITADVSHAAAADLPAGADGAAAAAAAAARREPDRCMFGSASGCVLRDACMLVGTPPFVDPVGVLGEVFFIDSFVHSFVHSFIHVFMHSCIDFVLFVSFLFSSCFFRQNRSACARRGRGRPRRPRRREESLAAARDLARAAPRRSPPVPSASRLNILPAAYTYDRRAATPRRRRAAITILTARISARRGRANHTVARSGCRRRSGTTRCSRTSQSSPRTSRSSRRRRRRRRRRGTRALPRWRPRSRRAALPRAPRRSSRAAFSRLLDD